MPSAPEGLTATPGDTTVTLHWSPPPSDGGSPITGYIVEESPDGITAWATVEDGDGDDTDTTATITGLKNGTLYYFRILAVNDNGTGPPSLDVKITPQLDAPTYGVSVAAVCVDLTPLVDVMSTGTGDIRVSVGPESVVLTADKPRGSCRGRPSMAARRTPRRSGTPSASTRWQPFDNGVLTLPAECPPPPIVPSAPEGLTATPGDTTVTLQWSPPTSDGGSPITDYIVEQSPDGITAWTTVNDGCDGTDTSATITGLTNGTLLLLPDSRRQRQRHRPGQPRRQGHPAHRADRAAVVGGGADQRVRPDPPDLGGAVVERRLGDHRLHHPALAQRHVELDDDQRRRQHRHRATP